jgi:hypothetical protein
MTPRASFELAIGALVLDGFEPGVRHACAGAFTRELERLVRERGFPDVPAGGAPEWRLPVLSIATRPDDPPSHVGRALARRLFDALQRAAENA